MIEISVLVDDSINPNNSEFLPEHGLSVLLETNTQKILFDTGRSGSFCNNASILNKPLNNIDNIVISHAHYDHANGLKFLADKIDNMPNIYVGSGFFSPKFKLIGEKYKYVGLSEDILELRNKGTSFNEVSGETFKIAEDVFIIRANSSVKYSIGENRGFYIQTDSGFEEDYFEDEISLVVKQEDGILLLVGCSHNGIDKIVQTAQKEFKIPIKYVFGGFHLRNSGIDKVLKVIEIFKKAGVLRIFTGHCTGTPSIDLLSNSGIKVERIFSGYDCTI